MQTPPSPAVVLGSAAKPSPKKKSANENPDEIQEATEDYYRFIGETAALRQLFTEAAVCRSCRKGTLNVTFDSVCLGTVIETKCTRPVCQSRSRSTLEGTSMVKGKHNRITDYAINVEYVLSMILSGDGGTEAGRTLGLMDLPNGTSTMQKTSFPAIEYELSHYIVPYTKELLEANLLEEVCLTYKDDPSFDYKAWKQAWTNGHPFPYDKMPKVFVSYDMGWQKRSSGRRYDSHSGHAAVVGVNTRKPIWLAVMSKLCNICLFGEASVDAHDCTRNFEGSSGSMEPSALVMMAHHLLDKNYLI